MTKRMVKSSWFGKIAKQAGRNKRAGRKYFLDLLNKQAENLRAGWQKNLKNLSKHALLVGTLEFVPYTYISIYTVFRTYLLTSLLTNIWRRHIWLAIL